MSKIAAVNHKIHNLKVVRQIKIIFQIKLKLILKNLSRIYSLKNKHLNKKINNRILKIKEEH
jgi:hypothetical protein